MRSLTAVALALLAVTTAYPPPINDLLGTYCGRPTNRVKCCSGRLDDCSHEIKGTLCYCDEFCSRNGSKHDDCCPDYESVCLGAPAPLIMTTSPPGLCTPGETTKDNCNSCKCKANGGYADWDCTNDECIITSRVLQAVNGQPRGWTAHNYSEFWGRKLSDGLTLKLGTLPLSERTLSMKPDPSYPSSTQLPSSFDARAQWPGYVSPVREQGWCGADWAVSTAAVASDRFAIQSNGAETVHLSAQHLLCTQGGCKGGYVDSAWLYVRHKGLVDEECFPYTGVRRGRCPKSSATLSGSGCRPAGPGGRTERYRTSPVKRLGSVQDIMYEIYNSGPVQAVMRVHQDFFAYRTGVYRHVPSSDRHGKSALHTVRIVGWGEHNGEKYWTISNSWGTEWGEEGYFRIARGENESEVETFVLSTLADVYEANTEPSL